MGHLAPFVPNFESYQLHSKFFIFSNCLTCVSWSRFICLMFWICLCTPPPNCIPSVPCAIGAFSHMAPSWCNALPLIWLHPVICSGFLRSHWKLFCSSYFWFYIVCCVWCSDTCESCFYKSVIFISAFCSNKVRLDCAFLTWKYSDLCITCKCIDFSCKSSSCSFTIWDILLWICAHSFSKFCRVCLTVH